MPMVTSLSFWLHSWEQECCGPERRVGHTVEATLLFEGEVRTTNAPPLFQNERDGRCVAIGEVVGKVGNFPGYLVRAPEVTFAVLRGNPPAERVACDGMLWEERHGPTEWPSEARNAGRIEDIWYCRIGDDGEPQTSTRIYNTSKRPARDCSWALRFVMELETSQ
jgi:hypothetical protein